MPDIDTLRRIEPTQLEHSIDGPYGSTDTYENINSGNGASPHSPGTVPHYVNSHLDHPGEIAICGLALRLPGGIDSAEAFWDVLVNGRDTRAPIPASRYNPKGFDDSLGHKGAIKTQYGYFLNEDLSTLDTSFFSMTQSELEKTDPQQRQLLEVTRECLENAGEVDYRGKPIGCYIGTFGEDWLQMSAKEAQHSGGYIMTGHGDLMIANRVSFEYDLQGPSMVIKTGCSASLVGLHEACRALQSGDCTAAIVAGTNLIMGPTTTAAMTQEGILSPEGSCKTFDASADGFARGEAISAVFIKRLDQALHDKSPVRAIIRNTATNSDGKSAGLMTPNGKSHEALMRKVYLEAGLDPRETAFVECHGTGTPTGDPIETTAVGNIFGENGIYIGSVKPNVGHAEGASGISSLIKAVLALEHNLIPPNIKFSRPNPKIPFQEKGLKVPIKATPWPHDRARRISVNSFGIGGSNAHVIVDSATKTERGITRTEVPRMKDPYSLLVLSANTQESLRRHLANYHEYINAYPSKLTDIAYTLALRREHLPYRSFLVASDSLASSAASIIKVPAKTPDVILAFNGQGAQWPEMGRALIQSNYMFREDIKGMDRILQTLRHPPKWTIESELQKPAKTSQINCAELAQPLCTAIQIALVNQLRHYGIRPKAVVGHSSGEIAAAYASGALTLPLALITSYYRGFVTRRQDLVGGMAAIGLGRTAVAGFLEDGVVLACENSPHSTTISGDLENVQHTLAKIREAKPEVLARLLKVDMAYHSHQMRSLGSLYRALLDEELGTRKLAFGRPKITMFSSVTGKAIESCDSLGPDYWETNQQSPVLFSSAATDALHCHPNSLFIEIGPHSTLAGPLRQICAEAGCTSPYLSTMLRGGNCAENLYSALGQLYQLGIHVNFERVFPEGRALTDLPRYPWEHNAQFWYENRVSREWRFREFGHHGLLGLRVPESTSMQPCWRNVLHLEDEPWLYDHKIQSDVVFPFAGYIAMAGEAIRQITGTETGYSLRHVVAHTALVLVDTKPAEIITTLRPHRLTDSDDSEFYDFVVSSHNGSSWTKNCEGIVRASTRTISGSSPIRTMLRKVIPSKWYEAMADVGIVYGPEFRRLTSITSSPTDCLATGEIAISEAQREAAFLFHPAAIDACLQLLLVAMAKGLGRNLGQLAIPTIVEELDISQATMKMDTVAYRSGIRKDMGVECFADGKTVLRLSGLQLTPLEDQRAMSADRHAASRLEWCPHFEFMDIKPLFKPPKSDKEETYLQEEMALLCMVDSAERLRGLRTDQPHLYKFRDWLTMEIHRAEQGTYPLLKDSAHFVKLPHSRRREMIQERLERLSTMSDKRPVSEGLMRICDNAEDIFTGKADTLDILMREDLLTNIYNVVSFGHSEFVRMLSHAKPYLRILEVGAGTGGTTELILRDLVDTGGHPAYSTYTFTDISAGFFPQAKERFSYASNIDYKVFDISQPPQEQGFEAASFDLILAPNVVHATPCLFDTLSNLQLLLRPDGHLVLTELSAVVRAPNYIFGHFSGWWLGEADGRPYEPYIPVARWDRELKAAGFTGVDTAVLDAEEPYQYCAVIVTQAKTIAQAPPMERSVTLLCNRPEQGIAKVLSEDIERSGMTVSICGLEDISKNDQDIISCLDLEMNFFENIAETDFLAFQDLLRNMKSRKLLWLTKPAQVNCHDPGSAYSIGVARTSRSELAVPFFTLEIDTHVPEFSMLVMKVFVKVRSSEDSESLLPDREYVVDKGIIKIGRYHPFSLPQEMSTDAPCRFGEVKALEIDKPGLLQTLHWKTEELPSAIPNDFVEIQTRAVGLNFRDVVYAMGVISPEQAKVDLGLEAAGIVSRVGRGVHRLVEGDRVFALAPSGCFSTRAVLPASLCVNIPDSLSFEEAATMPICFATAIQSLINVGQAEKGQKVLIHSATGGVGHASIEICTAIGAEVYATVGSEQKAQYLNSQMGLPRDRIFDSRSESFVDDLMAKTGGKGVDIVLNSLSGELLHASWKCVAEFGKLIELGKRDLAGFGKLDMEVFLRNRSYCCVDVAHLTQDRPEKMGSVVAKCLEMYKCGDIHPIRPVTFFEAPEIEKGFRCLQKGDHIGKVVIRMPEDVSTIASSPRTRTLSLNPKASYLLVGGLGGLGKSIATWMVEHGARSLVFLSRSAGSSSEDCATIAELEDQGCLVSTVAGKVQDMNDVLKAVSSATYGIKGVIHLAMVLQDAPIVDMTYKAWSAVIAPKVVGAWNLHNAFLNDSLDFFIMASSLVTIVDQPGQGNYQAANTFLESFCQYRHSLSLAASVLNICPIEGVGFVAENSVARKNLKSQGLYFLGEKDFLDYMELSFFNQHPPVMKGQAKSPSTAWKNRSQLVMGLRSALHLDDPNNRTNWRRDRRMAMYHNVRNTEDGNTGAKSDALKSFLSQAVDDPEILGEKASIEYIALEIGQKVLNFMLRPDDDVDISLGLSQIGLDSLMAIELRRWWKQAFKLEISVLEIMASGTLEQLGKIAAEGVKKKLQVGNGKVE